MGGFRFNGCGVTDHFKKIKSLGMHMCPVCGRASEFFLEEAKQKIDIIFIPTVTLKSRYAVMCSKCEQGEFCSDQWALELMHGAVPASAIFESEAQKLNPPPEAAPEQPPAPPPPQPSAPPPKKEAGWSRPSAGSGIPTFFKCAHCGVTQIREGDFCAYCGKPAPEGPHAKETPERTDGAPAASNTCPSCGKEHPPGSKFCSSCGQPLGASQPARPVCPHCGAALLDGLSFCTECGAKL